MCGICGIFRPDGGPIDSDRVVRMRDAMVPRGPDGAGLSQGRGFVLGHLAIVRARGPTRVRASFGTACSAPGDTLFLVLAWRLPQFSVSQVLPWGLPRGGVPHEAYDARVSSPVRLLAAARIDDRRSLGAGHVLGVVGDLEDAADVGLAAPAPRRRQRDDGPLTPVPRPRH